MQPRLPHHCDTLLRAFFNAVKPNFNARVGTLEVGLAAGMSEDDINDATNELEAEGYFNPVGFGNMATMTGKGRRYCQELEMWEKENQK